MESGKVVIHTGESTWVKHLYREYNAGVPMRELAEYMQGTGVAEMMPDNSNIQHMITLRDSIPKFTTDNTDVNFLSNALFQKLQSTGFDRINDVESYATIVDWLYNMDSALNLAPGIDLSCLWRHAESYSLKAVSSLMYSAFCGNKDAYDAYLKDNRPAILGYLKRKTKSHTIKVDGGCIKVKTAENSV